jgi:ATP-dependent Clp endopeptidase proteolytic subunit ClpP
MGSKISCADCRKTLLGRERKSGYPRKEEQIMTKRKVSSEQHQHEEQHAMPSFVMMQPPQDDKSDINLRKIGLIGDVTEEKSSDIIYGLYALKEMGRFEEPPVSKRGKPKVGFHPMDFLISTNGGSASDMFAIYDVMREIRKDCVIATHGLGKVMSAGVLLLAAGTKGERKIGKHCRVMIHGVIAGNSGPMFNLENEMNEVRETQKRYIEALKAETKMSTVQINKFLERHVDIYLSAEEAVKLGIVDKIV